MKVLKKINDFFYNLYLNNLQIFFFLLLFYLLGKEQSSWSENKRYYSKYTSNVSKINSFQTIICKHSFSQNNSCKSYYKEDCSTEFNMFWVNTIIHCNVESEQNENSVKKIVKVCIFCCNYWFSKNECIEEISRKKSKKTNN